MQDHASDKSPQEGADRAPQGRRGGRENRRASRSKPRVEMLPGLTNNLPFTEPLSEDEIIRIDNASMDILEDVGVVFRDDIALEDWKKGRC